MGVSLINKMLKDLEARENAPGPKPAPKPVYEDLRPVGLRRASKARPRPALMIILLAAAAGGGAYFWFEGGPEGLADRLASLLQPAPIAEPPQPARTVAAAGAPSPAPPSGAAQQPVAPEATNPESKKAAIAVTKPETQPVPPATGLVAVTPVPVQKSGAPAGSAKPPAGEQAAVLAPAPKPRVRAAAETGNEAGGPTVLEKTMKPLAPQEEAENDYRQAGAKLHQGRAADAEPLLAKALRADPGHVKARELAAGLALRGGRWREAQQLLTQGLSASPKHYPFAQMLARIHVEQGADAQALATMEAARAAGEQDADFLSFLATLYQRAGKPAEAVQTYTAAVKLRPQDGRTWLGLGISLEAQKEATAAAEAYQRALASGGLDNRLQQYAQQRLAILKK